MTRSTRLDHQTGLFAGHDGLSLFEQTWQPRRVSGMVAIVHGVAEHSGRYAQLAQDLGAAGYAVTSFDLRGHGRSEGLPTMVRSFDEHLADLALFVDRAQSRCAGQPLFLLGHSMGGPIAALYAIERQPELNGLILSAPSVRTGLDEPAALLAVVRTLNALAPRMPFYRIDSRGLSRDPDVVNSYDSDPLVYRGGLRPATLLAMRDASTRVQAGAKQLTVPLLLIHGGADPLVPVASSHAFMERVGSPDRTLRVFDSLMHETLNEPERDGVLSDLIAWLDAHR